MMLRRRRIALWIGAIICIIAMVGCGRKTPEETFVLAEKTLNGLESYSTILTYNIMDGDEVREYVFKQWVSMPSCFKIELMEPADLSGKTILSDGEDILISYPKVGDSIRFEMKTLEQQRPLFIGDFINSYWLSPEVEKRVEVEDGVEYVVLRCPVRGIGISKAYQEFWLRAPKMVPIRMVIYDEDNDVSSLILFDDFNDSWEAEENFFEIKD
ncbi:MAG TPA: hypothetical protein VFD57_03135 [Clostridia bacterium]|nr:hypothetical protein [Clostridia bacterium]